MKRQQITNYLQNILNDNKSSKEDIALDFENAPESFSRIPEILFNLSYDELSEDQKQLLQEEVDEALSETTACKPESLEELENLLEKKLWEDEKPNLSEIAKLVIIELEECKRVVLSPVICKFIEKIGGSLIEEIAMNTGWWSMKFGGAGFTRKNSSSEYEWYGFCEDEEDYENENQEYDLYI